MTTKELIERARVYDTSAICPECGPVLRVDEDGCCHCGEGAMGEGVGDIEDIMAGLVLEVERLTRELERTRALVEAAFWEGAQMAHDGEHSYSDVEGWDATAETFRALHGHPLADAAGEG